MNTLTSREICERLSDRIGTFVSTAYDVSPQDFKAFYRNRVHDFPGGFRRIDLVPKALMLKKIARDCPLDPVLALNVMKNWYGAKSELRQTVAGALQSLGYAIAEPDFEKDIIAHQSLASKHIVSENEAYYFLPDPNAVTTDKLELTVMAALLGWFPEPAEKS